MNTQLQEAMDTVRSALANLTELHDEAHDPNVRRLVRHTYDHLEKALDTLTVLDDLRPVLQQMEMIKGDVVDEQHDLEVRSRPVPPAVQPTRHVRTLRRRQAWAPQRYWWH